MDSSRSRSRSRSRSLSRSRSPNQGSDFPLIILIPKIFASYLSDHENIQRLRNSCLVNRLLISKAITDTSDELILTIEAEHDKKLQALKLLFEGFATLEQYDFKKNGLTILIPSHIVSVLIGKGGSQIKKFQTQSQTEISVIDKMAGMQERQVKIHGMPEDIKNAIESIHRLIKDRVISPEPSKGESVNRSKTYIKFIVPKSSVGILIGKGGAFAKEIKSNFSVEIKLLKNEKCSSRELENIALITGTRLNLEECLPKIIDKICDIQSTREESIRLLIPQSTYRNIYETFKDIQNTTYSKIRAVSENDEYVINIDGSSDSKKQAIMNIFRTMKDGNGSKRKSDSPRKDTTISIDVTVPDRMVSRLIGKKGEHVKNMIDKSGCSITFHKTFENVLTPEGEDARLCTLKGNTSSISIAVRTILEQVSKLEHD